MKTKEILNKKIDNYIQFLKNWNLYNRKELSSIEKCLKSLKVQEQISFLRLTNMPTGCSDNISTLLSMVNYRY